MSKYNQKTEPVIKRTTTHQGGQGFTQTPEMELVGILSTGMSNTFYEKETEREKRFIEVLGKVAKKDKLFAAKALIYARSVFGQRSVTHFGSVEMLPFLQGDGLGKKFFSKRNKKEATGGIIWRLDDMTEILAAYLAKNGQKASIPNSIKKGFKDAIESADTYELAKYQMKGKTVSLVDIVNLVHPTETSKNGHINVSESDYLKATQGTKFAGNAFTLSEAGEVRVPALRALVLGILKQFNTAEDKNTDAGKKVAEAVKSGELTKVEAEKVLIEKKADNFSELIKSRKIGYLALLRNLRNILKTNDMALLDSACELLTEKAFIRKSLVWPHQIDIAMEIMLLEFSGRGLQKVTQALGMAYENSIPNLEALLPEGRNAVVIDTSGSMGSNWSGGVQVHNGRQATKINSRPIDKASLIGATFAKGTGADVYQFGTSTRKMDSFNPNDSINTIKDRFLHQVGKVGHGTAYSTILPELARTGGTYDRIVIITDEQGCDTFEASYKQYSAQYGTPYVYFINICGYSATMAKTGNKVFRLQGYSADIYEKIPKLEMNFKEVLDAINRIQI